MTLIWTPRLKRRFALAMLAFWVFALGAAWANACLLQARTTYLDPSFFATAGERAVLPGNVGVLAGQAQNQSPGEAPCLKLCDEGSQVIVKWQSSNDLTKLSMLPPATMQASMTFVAFHAPQPVAIARSVRADLPLRTRYMRLTL